MNDEFKTILEMQNTKKIADHSAQLAQIVTDIAGISYNETTEALTIYVATTGSDTTGDGSSGAPYATIAKALSVVPKTINHVITINIAAGTYAETVTITGFAGSSSINILGGTDLATAANFIVNNFVVDGCFAMVYLRGFSCATTAVDAVVVQHCRYAYLAYISATATAAAKTGVVVYASTAQVSYCKVSNHQYALVAMLLSHVFSNTWTAGSGNTTGLYALMGSLIHKSDTQPSGTTAQTSDSGAQIN